ncbi:MAG: hypothetical protein IIC63_07060 [Proteobacteria bacterium]|nr:hypothetical protein [Pseudomonadota bacterium]
MMSTPAISLFIGFAIARSRDPETEALFHISVILAGPGLQKYGFLLTVITSNRIDA